MRPSVSVVMPFAGDRQSAQSALEALRELETQPGDELILVDNLDSLEVSPAEIELSPAPGIEVVPASGERSPAHARNVGAERASGEWILFLDADCSARSGLLDAYFSEPIDERTGALAGQVSPAPAEEALAARYGAARGFLNQRQHLAHPYRPRAVAANLLVRRQAFEQLGGFYEGLRAAEDTDFSWRLQQLGWRLELRPAAAVEHRYRASVGELRRQWRGYAAGRAWLSRRYDGFEPQPAAARAAGRVRDRLPVVRRHRPRGPARAAPASDAGAVERGRYLALDALLAGEELAGFVLSNRPAARDRSRQSSRVVLVAERFPAVGDPLIDFARTLDGARVEAVSRPDIVALEAARALPIDYREDDGLLARLGALAYLVLRHPLRSVRDALRADAREPPLRALAPAVRRLNRDRGARVHALGAAQAQGVARRLASLAGRPLE